ncbi:hypothetical protein KM915_21070 [Cytobacillus oceanisediminis]|uniref:hypothetical protein n=1 Tax=Cytobacillus oceanisediminis TaxID=665099 RepID=UPI001C239186|nr:hypothetical protein [Cytobacillus oceanisediminis]MBU8732544.1 hypothetical protein [Cytobacillus oceanisediminis]
MKNPRFNISIQFDEEQKEWLEIMKQEFKSRVIKGNNDYFSLKETEEGNLTLVFSPSNYTSQKEFIESFEENVLKPARRAAGLE